MDQDLNEGNGFDWDKQCFRAPYPGKKNLIKM